MINRVEGEQEAIRQHARRLGEQQPSSVQVSIPLQTEGFAVSSERGLVYNDEVGMEKPWRQPPRQEQHE